jgi:hypothetical protein
MLLDPRQRLIFMEFCKSQAASSEALATQMENMVGVLPQMVRREKQKAAAFSIVALELAAVREEFSVKAEDVGDVKSS